MHFNFYAPTKVLFGKLDSNSLASEVGRFGKNVLIITGGKTTEKLANKIKALIPDDYNVKQISGVTTNPDGFWIEDIVNKTPKPDVILTVGGGSVHDSGKAISLLITHNGRLEQYFTDGEFGVPGITNDVIPIITVPTIFGTGSEVSPAALIRYNKQKKVIYSQYLYPQATFIDCSLALSLPKDVCVYTALDALTQGIESFVSKKAQPFSKRFSISAIERTVKSLVSIDNNGVTTEALEELALASIESLYAVGQTTVGAIHAISDPLSGIYNMHHGIAVGLLLPYVSEVNYKFSKSNYDIIMQTIDNILNIKSQSFKDSILSLYKIIGFNIDEQQKSLLKAEALIDYDRCIKDSYNGDMVGNPRDFNDNLIRSILEKIIIGSIYED